MFKNNVHKSTSLYQLFSYQSILVQFQSLTLCLISVQLSDDGFQIITRRSSPPDTTTVPSLEEATAVTAPI
jgi:hypothetical protein